MDFYENRVLNLFFYMVAVGSVIIYCICGSISDKQKRLLYVPKVDSICVSLGSHYKTYIDTIPIKDSLGDVYAGDRIRRECLLPIYSRDISYTTLHTYFKTNIFYKEKEAILNYLVRYKYHDILLLLNKYNIISVGIGWRTINGRGNHTLSESVIYYVDDNQLPEYYPCVVKAIRDRAYDMGIDFTEQIKLINKCIYILQDNKYSDDIKRFVREKLKTTTENMLTTLYLDSPEKKKFGLHDHLYNR